MSPDPVLYLEDLIVGRRFRSAARLIEEAQITAFAAQFDPQPFHLDDAAARQTMFGGLAASGWHTASVTMALLVETLPIAGGVIGAGVEVSWPHPTRPGDVLSIEIEILEARKSRSRPDRGVVIQRTVTRNQHGEIVQTMTATLIVPRRPGPNGSSE